MRADVENLQDQLANSPRRSPSHNGSSPEHMPGEVPAHVLSPKRLGIDADGDAQLVARQMAENHDMGGISGVSGTSGVSNEGSNGSSAQNKPWHDNNAARVRDLECKLEQTASEVCRLRQERRRLMDVGNELRAAVNRTQMSRSFDQADFSAIYDASPGTMASSKNGHDRPSTAPYGAMSASHKERVEQCKQSYLLS
jgi:TolA-binding protein